MSGDRISAVYQTLEAYTPHFVPSIEAAERVTVDPGDENFVFEEGGSELSPKQKSHMMRMANILKYSPSVIDTSSTGAGKSYVALGLFEFLKFSFLRVICPNQLVPVWNGHFKRSGLALTTKNYLDQDVLQYNTYGEIISPTRNCLNRNGEEEPIPIAKVTTYELLSSLKKGILTAISNDRNESMSYMNVSVANEGAIETRRRAAMNGFDFDAFEYLIKEKDGGPAETVSVDSRSGKIKESKRNLVYGRNYEEFAWNTCTQKYLFVVDEAQKVKNSDTNTSWIMASRLNSTLFPDTYKDGQGANYSGGRSRVLFLSATPFDKLEHVYVYYVITGMTTMPVGITSYTEGRDHKYVIPGVYQIWYSLLSLIDRAYEYHRGTMVKASQSFYPYSPEQADFPVRLYPEGGPEVLKQQVGALFQGAGLDYQRGIIGTNYSGTPGETNLSSIGATLFEIYVKFCKHVLSSYVTKPFTPGVKRYCANLFLDLDYETAVAAYYEADQYEKIGTRDNNEPGAHMIASGTFRRYTSILKACRLARVVIGILDNTLTDKIVIFVSENETEGILRDLIERTTDKHNGGYYQVRVAAGESKKPRSEKETQSNEKSLAEFQRSDPTMRVLIAKLSVFSIGQSMHDLDGRFPRHTFILPDPNLTEVSQSIGRTIRVGMKSSAAVYIVYLGQLVGTIDDPIPAGVDENGFTWRNFGEITKVYKNLMSKTLIMKQILLGSDMDFPGDFDSVKECDVINNGGFYRWSRAELLQKYPDQEQRLMPRTYFDKSFFPPIKVESGARIVAVKRFEKRAEELGKRKNNPTNIPAFAYPFFTPGQLASVGINPASTQYSGQYSGQAIVPSNYLPPKTPKGRKTTKKGAAAARPSFLTGIGQPMSTGFAQAPSSFGGAYSGQGVMSAPGFTQVPPSSGLGFLGQGQVPPSSGLGFLGQGQVPPSSGIGFPGQGQVPPSSGIGFPGQGQVPPTFARVPSSGPGFPGQGSSSSSSVFPGFGGRGY